MKIALFMFPVITAGGGAERYFIELAGNLGRREKLKVDVITLDRTANKIMLFFLSIFYLRRIRYKERESEKDVLRLLSPGKWRKATFFSLSKIIREYNIVYAKNEIIDLLLLKLIGYRNLPPIVVGVHTPIYYPFVNSVYSRFHNILYLSFFYKLLLKGVKLIHVVNSDDKKMLDSKFNAPTKLIFYPFEIVQKNRVLNKTDRFRILFAGRISEQKGIDVLIKIIEGLSTESVFKKFSFRIAGSGDSEMSKKLVKLSERFDNVEYLGHVFQKNMKDLYNWTDVTIIPSRYETVNYVALETGAYGKIAVASDIPGPRDVIINGRTGFLLPLKADIFIKKIKELCWMKERRLSDFISIGENAQKHILAKFNRGKIYREIGAMLAGVAR